MTQITKSVPGCITGLNQSRATGALIVRDSDRDFALTQADLAGRLENTAPINVHCGTGREQLVAGVSGDLWLRQSQPRQRACRLS